MSTLRISNIEAKADSSSPTVDEQLRFTNSDGDLMLYLDGRTAGITTVGINTTNQTIKFDANNNILITGIITATEFHGALAVGTSVTYGDNEKAYFGNGLDMSLYHDGTNSYLKNNTNNFNINTTGSFVVASNAGGNVGLVVNPSGATSIRYANSVKLATTVGGINVTGTTDTDNLNITGVTTSAGIVQAAQFKLLDNAKAKYGTGEDLEIYHNATNSLIQNGTGSLQIITTTGNLFFRGQDNITFNTAGNNERLRIGSNGSVGIGTDYLSGNATVYHKLMVEGDTTSTIAVAKILRKNASASNSTYTLEGDSSAHTSNMSSGGAMAVDVYSGRAFTINGNGWVGIGTNNPSQKVSIAKGRVNIDVNNDYYGVWFDGDTQGENHVSVGRWYNTGGGLKSGYSQYGINNLILENNHPTASHSLVIQPKGQKVAIGTHLVDDDHIVNVKGAVVADGFISNGGALSHRNVVINGGMEISQRGTISTGNTSGGYKTCDRWELSLNTAGTWTVTRSGTCPDGFNHSIKLDCTTANTSLSATSFLEVRTAFEGQDLRRFAKGTTSAKPITVSFYVKTNKNGTYAVELYDVDNTKIATSLYTVSNSNWNRYEFTIPASTNTGQFVNDNNKSLTLGFILAAGTNYTNGTQYGFFVQGSNLNRAAGLTVNLADSTSNEFYLTGVQMEEGSVATPFEHKSFTEELTRCYRYYRRFGANGSLPTPAPYNRFSIGYSPSSSDVRFPFQLDPPMRIKPVNSNFSKSGSFSIQPGSIGSYSLTCDDNSCSPSMLIAIMGSTSVSSGAGSAVSLHANNDTSAYIDISAEL